MPLYCITTHSDQNQRLVSASNVAHALRHVAGSDYHIDTPDGLTVAGLVTQGVVVEYAASRERVIKDAPVDTRQMSLPDPPDELVL